MSVHFLPPIYFEMDLLQPGPRAWQANPAAPEDPGPALYDAAMRLVRRNPSMAFQTALEQAKKDHSPAPAVDPAWPFGRPPGR